MPVRKFSTVRKTYALIASCPRNVARTVRTLYGNNRRRRRQSLPRGNQPDLRLRAIYTSSDLVLCFGIPTRRSARPRQESTDVWEQGSCCCTFALRESCMRRRRRSKAGCCQAAAIHKLRE
ncbi:unnamed protein product [Sphagnum troendelagicum]